MERRAARSYNSRNPSFAENRTMNFTVPVLISLVSLALCASLARAADDAGASPAPEKVIRAGIIGLDTSHAPAFTDMFNDPNAGPEVAGVKIVAAFPGGSDDLPS